MTAVVNTEVPKWMSFFLFSSSFFPSFLPSLISVSSCHLTFAASSLVPLLFSFIVIAFFIPIIFLLRITRFIVVVHRYLYHRFLPAIVLSCFSHLGLWSTILTNCCLQGCPTWRQKLWCQSARKSCTFVFIIIFCRTSPWYFPLFCFSFVNWVWILTCSRK